MSSKNAITFAFSLLLISSCATIGTKYNRDLVNKSVRGSQLFNNHFTGFALYDPIERKYIYEYNADKYFTPASNTKLLTFYAGLKLLNDSIPALKYYETVDSLIILGTGDPTFLHPDFDNSRVFDFLKSSGKTICLATGNFQDEPFGSGWAWDDYQYYFQSERSGFPIYGNVISFAKDSLDSVFQISPIFFENYTDILESKQEQNGIRRSFNHNIFKYYPDTSKSDGKNRIPFKTSDELLAKLLSDTLGQSISIVNFEPKISRTLFSGSTKELYGFMLKASDNFLAEQIQYLCAAQLGDTLRSARLRNHIIESYLKDFRSKPIWKDGSGLSRYNLITPRSLVSLLEKIKNELPEDELLSLLPIGGVDGTLKKWYVPEEGMDPFVFAKTGTLSNNHSLSGFVRVKSGKLLTFSFMHNNYNTSSTAVKTEMDKVLRLIRDRY